MDSRVNNEQSLCHDPWETALVKAKNREKECDWTGLKCIRDVKVVLVSIIGRIMRLIDAFHGPPLQTCTCQSNEASFNPDSQFLFSRSTDGRVHVWNANTGYEVCILNGDHPAPVQCLQFNLKYMILSSVSTNVAIWLPIIDDVA